MTKRKVLIITYYWPPTGGGGVYRWVKFVKYLREFGWEPIVYTPLNPEAGIRDESLLKDIPEDITVLKRKITEPYTLFKFFTGRKKDSSFDNFVQKEKKTGSGFKDKMSVWIRGNFFIPDARCMWIRPSVRFLGKWVKENPVDVIVSTGPPHSMHLIAQKVSAKQNIKWLADFRDPWTGIDFYEQLRIGKIADSLHKKLEKKVLKNADVVVTVSPSWGETLKELGAQHIEIVHNGFDPEDFTFLPVQTDDFFSLTHAGSLNKDRNPEHLWQALQQICNENSDFKNALRIRFLGNVDFSVKESLEKFNLLEKSVFSGYVPHTEALKMMAKSSVLVLLTNNTPNVKGIIPGKMYEYLACNRPVLLIAPFDSDSAGILKQVNGGYLSGFNDVGSTVNVLNKLYDDFLNNTHNSDMQKIHAYSRKNLTKKITDILNNIQKF